MSKRNLFDDDVHWEISRRIDQLRPDTEPEWGTMSVGQMLAHCAEIVEVANGKELEGTPFYVRVMGPVLKRMIVSEKSFPQAARTHPQYVVTEPKDFTEQKERLLRAVDAFRSGGPAGRKHPVFGKMTAEERGWSNYKHLDHHLRQFGV